MAWLSVIAFLLLVSGALTQAQQPTKVPRIGHLIWLYFRCLGPHRGIPARSARARVTEGKNINIEWRSAEGKLDRLPELAAELVRLKVDIIVTAGPAATRAAKDATSRFPLS